MGDNTSLYSFTSHKFTNAGAEGRTGPTLAQVKNAYGNANWTQNSNYLNMTTQGIQEWKVPATGSYTIQAVGASSGINTNGSAGRGISITATIPLIKNTIVKILIGQQGGNSTSNNSSGGGGGGGGTYVYIDDSTPLIIAGGGGGPGGANSDRANGRDASSNLLGELPSNKNGTTINSGQTNGNGGTATAEFNSASGGQYNGAAGAGFLNNGGGSPSSSYSGTTGGAAPKNGGDGGNNDKNRIPYSIWGGFGGGGGANDGGGGGGGYTGGNNGIYAGTPILPYSGGSGGSYAISSMIVNGYNTGHGSVIISANFTINVSVPVPVPVPVSVPAPAPAPVVGTNVYSSDYLNLVGNLKLRGSSYIDGNLIVNNNGTQVAGISNTGDLMLKGGIVFGNSASNAWRLSADGNNFLIQKSGEQGISITSKGVITPAPVLNINTWTFPKF